MSPAYPTIEIRPVPSFPTYGVNCLGVVFSRFTPGDNTGKLGDWRPLKPIVGNLGYLVVGLHRRKKFRMWAIHRLVAEVFFGPCPAHMEVCHYDGDPTNNVIENLRYDTRKGNCADSKRHGTNLYGARQNGAKLNDELVIQARERYAKGGISYDKLARQYGVTIGAMWSAINRKTWNHIP
jgi:hypothetical protein